MELLASKSARGDSDLPKFCDILGDDDAADFVSELKDIQSSMLHQIQRLSKLEAAVQTQQRAGPNAKMKVLREVKDFGNDDSVVTKKSNGELHHPTALVNAMKTEPRGDEHPATWQGIDHADNEFLNPMVNAQRNQSKAEKHADKLDSVLTTEMDMSHTDTVLSSRNSGNNASVERSALKTQKSFEGIGKLSSILAEGERKMRQETEKVLSVRSSWDDAWDKFLLYRPVVFETVMGGVVLVNSLTIGISCDVGSASFWNAVDSIFAAVFSFELIVKVATYGCREFLSGQYRFWNLFELLLVALAWGELALALASSAATEGVNLLVLIRMFRLARVARLVRLFKLEALSELLLMMKGALGGMRTLFWSSVLIFWPLYVAALVLRETLGGIYSDEYFRTVPMAFFTLFRCVITSECTDSSGRPLFYLVALDYGWGFVVLYMALVVLVVFGLFNVIIAIYVDNVMAAAKSDEQRLRKQRLSDEAFFNEKMFDLIQVLWDVNFKVKQENGRTTPEIKVSVLDQVAVTLKRMEHLKITPELFGRVLLDKRAKRIFDDLDVSDEDQFNLFDMLDVDSNGILELTELYEGINKLRGPARRSDVIANNILIRRVLQGASTDDGSTGFQKAQSLESKCQKRFSLHSINSSAW